MRPDHRARRSMLAALGSLLILAGLLPLGLVAPAAAAATVFINELHYDNASNDVGEAIEVAGPAGTDLTGWSIVLYNGAAGFQNVYATLTLSGSILDLQNGYGTASVTAPGLQNGAPDGLALVNGSSVVQFLSYEGSFTALDGPAAGMTSTDIGVAEAGTEAVGLSIGLTGIGATYEDYTWSAGLSQSFGSVNPGQTFGSGDTAPAVSAATPTNGSSGVPVDANVTVTFTEPVNVSAASFTLTCGATGNHAVVVTGGPTAFTLDPAPDFANAETCTFTVLAAQVTDQDAMDPPDHLSANHVISFRTIGLPVTPTTVWINEIHYDNGGTDAGEAVEIAGPAGTDLTGWTVVLYNGSNNSAYDTDPLSGTIPAQQAGFGTVVLSYPVNGLQNGSPDGIALVSPSGVVQFVSYEGPMTGANGPALNVPAEALTVVETGSEALGQSLQLVGTGNDYGDFTWSGPIANTMGAPNTGQTFLGAEAAPEIASTSPRDGAVGIPTGATVTITFNESVDVSDGWYAIECSTSGTHTATVAGGPSTFTLDPDTLLANDEVCTVTVHGAAVTDQDTEDGPDAMVGDIAFAFRTVGACGAPATLISGVQGAALASPMDGARVEIEGVVVGDYQGSTGLGGFYVQEEVADEDLDAATSEGVFVFDGTFGTEVSAGDRVRVAGEVDEFFELTELTNVTSVEGCGVGGPVTTVSIGLPRTSANEFEPFEGMSVEFAATLTVTETFVLGRFGEVLLSSGGRLPTPTAVAAPGAAATAQLAANELNQIVLDDGNGQENRDPIAYPSPGLSGTNTLRSGDTVTGLDGVMDFRFAAYRLQPVGTVDWVHANARPAQPADLHGPRVRVAAFNVLNYFNGDGLGGGFPTARGAENAFEFGRQRTKIVAAIAALDADIVGLMELENDASGNSAIEDLVAGLNTRLGAGTYDFVNTGVVGTDQIRVGIIFQPARVARAGAFAILDSTVDPRFNSGLNRPAVAQTFREVDTGELVTVAVNHLKSKGSDCNGVGDPDTHDQQGNCNRTRTSAAEALVDWLAGDPTASGDPDRIIVGDLNAYAREDPITAIKAGGYRDLIDERLNPGAYSYVFDGMSGYLDHALATTSLASQVTGITEWHINADEPIALDYNQNFKSAAQVLSLYAPDAFRSSDHDPVLIGLDLGRCQFARDVAAKAMTLLGDCFADETIDVPDGWTLDGDGFTITAVDPRNGHFVGAVVAGTGEVANVTDVGITAHGLADACDGGDDRLRGILFDGASGAITRTRVFDLNQGTSGCQEGNAIELRNFPSAGSDAGAAAVEISGNDVTGYQKTGILANGLVVATIEGNTISGYGPVSFIAQNGVQVGFGASATVLSNSIGGNFYTPKDTVSCGLLMVDAAGVRQQANTFAANERDVCNVGRGGGSVKTVE